MNIYKSFGTKCLSLVLIICTLMMNFSFKTSKEISLTGPDGENALHYGAKMQFYFFNEDATLSHSVPTDSVLTLSGVDSVKVGYYPEYGLGWNVYTKHATSKTNVSYSVIEYIIPTTLNLYELKQKNHKDFKLRFMAVSAPQWVSSGNNEVIYSLDSRTPFSLQNALRLGALHAQSNDYVWSVSNWSDSNLLSDSVFLLNYYEEEKDVFLNKLENIHPQILFIGSMTLSFPSAIAFAQYAKQLFGEKIFVVLGGKHAIETTYLKKGIVMHHPGSPVLLMHEGRIPQVFDLIVSGDGEEVVDRLGAVLGSEILSNIPLKNFSHYYSSFESIRGNFILSWIDNKIIKTMSKEDNPLDYDNLPSPVSLFGVNTSFPVFGTEKTAHVYSDMSKGCIMNCSFCSEANSINGKIVRIGNPEQRLYNQLFDASMQGCSISAFVEDSILLMARPEYLHSLAELLTEHPLPIVFGGQFTVDNLLDVNVQSAIKQLVPLGLSYIYTGMETSSESVALEMSKNTGKKNGTWTNRTEQAISFITSLGIKHGVSVLWGLGENQNDRMEQLCMIDGWQKKYNGNPVCVSPNWTTQHPLFDKSPFDYTEWGTDKNDPYLPYLVRLFGEASHKYMKEDVVLPSVSEMKDLLVFFKKLNIQNV